MAEFEIVSKITINCPECGHETVVRAGKQHEQQRYLCRNCSKKFRAGGKAKGHRFESEGVGLAIGSFFSGMSYRSISQRIRDLYDISKPSTASLYDWVHRYSTGAAEILSAYPATTGGHWAADEIEYSIGKDKKKFWMWVVIDKRTRYLLAIHLAWNKGAEQAKIALRKALAVAASPPAKITTDRAPSYYPAIRSVLPETRHIKSQGIRHFVNNNLCERANGTIRQRTKVLRGINDLETAQIMMDGWRLHYNFFRDHEGLKGQTPARAAKIDSPFKKWADLVRARAKAPKRKPKPRMHRIATIDSPRVKKQINLSKPKAEVSNGMVPMFNKKTLAPNKAALRQLRRAEEMARGKHKAVAPQPVMPRVERPSKPVGGNLEKRMGLDFTVSKLPSPKPAGQKRRR